MSNLRAYCGERIPVIDEETGEPTGEFVQPDGSPIIEGEVPLSDWDIADIAARQAAAQAQAGVDLKAEIVRSTQAALDAFAATRLYSGIMSACTYVNSTNPKFAAEGAYCVQIRDQTWAKLYEMLAEVEAGTRAIPSSFADIAGDLPVSGAKWPD